MRNILLLFILALNFQAFAAPDKGCLEKSLLFPTYNVPMKKKVAHQLVNSLSGLKQLDIYYREALSRVADNPDKSFFRLLLESLQIGFKTNKPITQAIPEKGPLIVMANHPFGGLDGIALLDFVTRTRDDVKLLINQVIVDRMPELKPYSVAIDVRNKTKGARSANQVALDEAKEFVQGGGAIIIFPAGSIAKTDSVLQSYFRGMLGGVSVDKPWKRGITGLTSIEDVSVLPVFFHGSNSTFFHAMGALPKLGDLRNALLIREIVNKRGLDLTISFGEPILPGDVRALTRELSQEELIKELRRRNESLKEQ